MAEAFFFRLLETPVEGKGIALADATDTANRVVEGKMLFLVEPRVFGSIPGSPFSYWAPPRIVRLFSQLESLGSLFEVKVGLQTSDDFRFVRCWWEVISANTGLVESQNDGGRHWLDFAKGGAYSPFYSDIHLMVNWSRNGKEIKNFSAAYVRNELYYYRPGVTWPRRTTSGISIRALPRGCIFADKGPVAFAPQDSADKLLGLLAIMNSAAFSLLIKLHVGAATAAARSYEVGVVQNAPVPFDFSDLDPNLVLEAHDLARKADATDETTHAFQLPGLARHTGKGLLAASRELESAAQARGARLAAIQAELDEAVFALYGLDPAEVGLGAGAEPAAAVEDEAEGEEEAAPPEDLPERVQNLLMWCVGVAFGRWDVRLALDPALLPALQGPFDPLPRCAPGALLGADGLPAARDNIAGASWLAARENVLDIPGVPLPSGKPATIPTGDYSLPIAWDGILVDDPTHPADLVNRVRQVLALLWGERAAAVEQEACAILGANTLRDYFRDPRKGFFPFHIRRYSKSRRKAPIYWLLQSANRSYAIWLYVHRMDESTYFTAARDYADTKVNLETTRLDELRQGLAALEGSVLKKQEREVDRQQKLVGEVTTFRNKLDAIALRRLPPDPNDGVIISIAPLHELVPWKEAAKMWHELVAGKYEWSTMSQQMKARGLVK